MGTEKKEGVVDELEDMLGLDKAVDEPKDSSTVDADKDKTLDADDKSTEDEATPATKTTAVTDEQITINQDIAKIDVKIEALQGTTVDTTSFYENLEEHLSEDEQALEFSDRPAYMKLINTKVKEFEEKGSKADEIQTLQDEKKEMQLVYDRQSAIVAVSAKFPEYNHEKVLSFFENDLTKGEQQKIFKSASSYADVYEKTYQKFLESNPSNIAQAPSPNIPNVNNVRKDTPNNSAVADGLKTEDELLQDALGFSN